LTLAELTEILDKDFVGHESLYNRIQRLPKYGNDTEAADSMVEAVSRHVCECTRQQAEKVGLDYFLIVNVNNYYNVVLGKATAASADGRRKGMPLANGNTPTAGSDKKGITAFLNSLTKISPDCHAGYTHNMKFSKELFAQDRPKLEHLLNTYFKKGGTQAMITAVSRGELEQAMIAPERFPHLMVRVGGFSARFIELERDVQLDILNRTLY